MPQNAFFLRTCDLLISPKTMQRHFLFTLHPLSTLIFATATVLAFVLLRNSNFNFHCYTQCEATSTQKSARKCAATSGDFFRERLQSAFTLAKQLRWIAHTGLVWDLEEGTELPFLVHHHDTWKQGQDCHTYFTTMRLRRGDRIATLTSALWDLEEGTELPHLLQYYETWKRGQNCHTYFTTMRPGRGDKTAILYLWFIFFIYCCFSYGTYTCILYIVRCHNYMYYVCET